MDTTNRPQPERAIADQADEIARAMRRLRKRARKELRKLRRDPVRRAGKHPAVAGLALVGAAGLAAAAVLLINRAVRRD
jgi:hypothetical protein